MKEKDILTDFKAHQLILYAEKEDDSIGPVLTGSYMAGNYLDDFYHIWGNFEKELFEKLLKKEISPIALYKSLEELSLAELAARAGIPKRRVKKHLNYRHFAGKGRGAGAICRSIQYPCGEFLSDHQYEAGRELEHGS